MENYGFGRRNGAIDMLRGLTMFLMIFVNDFWTIGDVPHWLEHTATHEDAMGLADLVFPLFRGCHQNAQPVLHILKWNR